MNSKMYLPAACLLFCVTHIIVAENGVYAKMLMVAAAAIFSFFLVKAWRGGK
ncbi:MAG: hypothetical protein FWH28_06835 [Clostridiales bacterium]|nr:hypothetical protein [Clostridiales bacterium]